MNLIHINQDFKDLHYDIDVDITFIKDGFYEVIDYEIPKRGNCTFVTMKNINVDSMQYHKQIIPNYEMYQIEYDFKSTRKEYPELYI